MPPSLDSAGLLLAGLPPFSYQVSHILNQPLAHESSSQRELLETRPETVKEQRERHELMYKVTRFLRACLFCTFTYIKSSCAHTSGDHF